MGRYLCFVSFLLGKIPPQRASAPNSSLAPNQTHADHSVRKKVATLLCFQQVRNPGKSGEGHNRDVESFGNYGQKFRADVGAIRSLDSPKEVWKVNFRQYGQIEKRSHEEAEVGRNSDVEKVRRVKRRDYESKKMQEREKVGKSRNTVLFHCFVAPGGRHVGSLKRRARR